MKKLVIIALAILGCTSGAEAYYPQFAERYYAPRYAPPQPRYYQPYRYTSPYRPHGYGYDYGGRRSYAPPGGYDWSWGGGNRAYLGGRGGGWGGEW